MPRWNLLLYAKLQIHWKGQGRTYTQWGGQINLGIIAATFLVSCKYQKEFERIISLIQLKLI